jgi:uncharacterized protein
MTRLISPLVFIIVLLLPSLAQATGKGEQLARAAMERTAHTVRYDGRYLRLAYPGGDVPDTMGVCTDVVIRAYRKLGIDLQVLVHQDMKAHFSAYPALWGLSRTDRNIDHRRVPNLQTFFRRQGAQIDDTSATSALQAGDVLTWMLPGNLPHTGIVVAPASADRPARIVHNIGSGPKETAIPSGWKRTGHYRFGG